MIGGAKVYTFHFQTTANSTYCKKFVAPSLQMAWVMAASYIACHTSNPPVTGMMLALIEQITEIAIDELEVSETQAIQYIHNL